LVFLVHLPWHMKTNLISHNKSLHLGISICLGIDFGEDDRR